MIKVYGRKTSSNVQAVLWCLAELGVEFEREDRGHVHGGTDTPEFLAMNPNGLVPVLVDGNDAPIFESAAIYRYLAAKYGQGDGFWPVDPAARAQVDKWAEWGKTTWGPAVLHGIFYPLVRTAAKDRDAVGLAAGIANLSKQAALLDTRLSGRNYLAGDVFSLADITVGHLLYRYFTVPFERKDLPHLAAYYERLQTRPAFADNAMVSYESLRAAGA